MSFFDDPSSSDNTTGGGGGGGDIWSTGAFAFDSPLKDLLDTQSYTLTDLLGEDELLQELRGVHPQLIDYFATEQAVEGLVRLLVAVPPPPPVCPITRAREEAERRRRAEEEAVRMADAEAAVMTDPEQEEDKGAPEEEEEEMEIRTRGSMDFGDPEQEQEEADDVTDAVEEAVAAVEEAAAAKKEEEEEEEEPSPYPDDEADEVQLAAAAAAAEEIDAPDDETDDNDLRNGGGGGGGPASGKGGGDSSGGQEQQDQSELGGGHRLRADGASPPERPTNASSGGDAPEPGQWMFGGGDGGSGGDNDGNGNDGARRTEQEEYDLKYIRYPYMACEVICCEVGGILNVLVEGRVQAEAEEDDEKKKEEGEEKVEVRGSDDDDEAATTDAEIPDTDVEDGEKKEGPPRRQSLLDLLFTMLLTTPPLTLDDRRAGYLEKILTVLFRTRPAQMTSYLNGTRDGDGGGVGGGPALLRAFLNHLHSHSIMQIVQRLMLPPPPGRGGRFNGGNGDGDGGDGAGGGGNEGNDANAGDANQRGEGSDGAGSKDSDGNDNDDDDDDDHSPAFGGGGGWPMISSAGVDEEDDDEDEDDDDLMVGPAGLVRCNWSTNVDAVGWLLDCLTGEGVAATADVDADSLNGEKKMEDALLDACQNASEVLVAVVQNSPLTSATVRTLSSEPALRRVIDAVCSVSSSAGGGGGGGGDSDGDGVGGGGGEFVMSESTVTLAMSVLESLVLQLGGYGAVVSPMTDDLPEDDNKDEEEHRAKGGNDELDADGALIVPEDDDDADQIATGPQPAVASAVVSPLHKPASAEVLITHLPRLLQALSELLRHPTTKSWLIPVQYSTERRRVLGSARLRIVRLIESLVLLGNTAVDELLCDSPALELCLDLFWAFPWCSMLHQSVANLLVHVLEGGQERVDLQRYFLIRCNLMGRLMASFEGIGTSDAAVSGDAFVGSDAQPPPPPPEQGELGPNQPRYSEVMFALKEFRSQESTSSVGSERGSSVSSADEDEDEEAGDDDVLPVSDDDVEAAIERQREKIQDMQVSPSAGSAVMEDADVGDGRSTAQADVVSGAVESMESTNLETESSPSAAAPAPTPKQAEFRMGYMGHVIIVCQALVHACTANQIRDQEESGDEGEGDADSFDAEIAAAVLPDMNGEIESSSSLGVILKGEEKGEEMEEDEQGQVLVSKKRKDRSFDEEDGAKLLRRDGSEQNDHSQEVQQQADNDDELISSHKVDSGELPDASFSSSPQEQEEQEGEEQTRPPIVNLLQTHPLYGTWQSFVTTTLASETAVQSTPLGGYGTSQPHDMNGDSHLHGPPQHRVSLTDEDLKNFMGAEHSDGVAGTVVAGAGGSPIELNDADLDIAASMMEAITLPPGSGGAAGASGEDGAGVPGHHRQHRVMAGFGAVVQVAPTQGSASGATGAGQYLYDDPLGGRSDFDDDDDSDDEEGGGDATTEAQQGQGDSDSGGVADEEEDVPVIDLFAGNFSFEGQAASSSGSDEGLSGSEEGGGGGGGGQGWANFANFDDAFAASAIPEPTPIAPSTAVAPSDVDSESQEEEAADIFASTPHLVDALADDDDTST